MKHQPKLSRAFLLTLISFASTLLGVIPSAPRAIGAPLHPFVAKRTRIEIRTLTGKSNYVSPQKAEQLFQEKRIIWTDEAHLYATMSLPLGYGDYSNVLTNRCLLTVRQSGYAGPLVVQLL